MHNKIDGLKFTALPGFICYSGSTAALVAAGHLRPDQVPGTYGNPATCASFHPNGTRVQKGARHATKSVGYVKVQRMRGDTLRVMRSVEEVAISEPVPECPLRPDEHHTANWPFRVVVGGLPS